MKINAQKIMLAIISLACIVSCNLNNAGYEYSTYSLSDFEFSYTELKDSLRLDVPFGGGSRSVSLVFNSARENEGDELTGGFAVTAKRDSSLQIASGNAYPQYTMFAKTAANRSNICSVFYQNPDESLMPEHDILFLDADYGTCTPISCQINNTQQVVYEILEGENKFEQGDYLKLTVTGFLNGNQTGKVDFYLADHRGMAERPDSVLTAWKGISLSRLKNVDCVDFSLECTKDIPLTVCMDNFYASIYVSR